MSRVSCMAGISRQTSFVLFPILIIPVLGMESPQRDPRPPPYPPPSMQVLTPCMPRPTTISLYCAWTLSLYPHNCSECVILTSPDITHTCWSWHHAGIAIRKALSGRNCHHIRPAYSTHSRTVLCHIDMGRITPYMPYHYIPSEKSKR